MQTSLASQPNFLKKRKKKVTQPGGHFEIPGAHLANPGNWGVYISATEKGKRPDAPLSCSAASIQRSLKSPWVTDLCVCGGLGRGRGSGTDGALGKVTKHPMMTCSRET